MDYLIAPLIVLYFTVDQKRILQLFFFKYTVHMLWTYNDTGLKYFVHTYFLKPILPNVINMTASALPVSFLLLYQYCMNKNKNFYLYTLGLSAVFSFGFATVESYMGLAEMRKG